MKTVFARSIGVIVSCGLLAAIPARAEVTRFDVTSRQDLPVFGYERIVGRLYFAVNPGDPRNAVVVDLDKAPRNADGRVEFSADVEILRPKTGGNGAAILDVVNRGRQTVGRFNTMAGGRDPEFGDGFLMQRGFTVVAVGWEFDVPARSGAVRIALPAAADGIGPVTGMVRATFTPDRRDATLTVGDLVGYVPRRLGAPEATLTVRDNLSTPARPIARDQWTITANAVSLTGGFEPGQIYELSYEAESPPVAGLGFAAVRDAGSWMRRAGDGAPVKYLYAFGSSQSGRFLRNFLYEGFNSDEGNRQVFDGVMAHIAGAARIDLNRRWSTPTSLSMFAATAFPFADAAQQDPVSGVSEGMLDNERARRNQPKVFYTNTGVEYWGGGRSAALTHTSADGKRDLTLPGNVRSYFFAGAQHSPGSFPPEYGSGQQMGNPTDYWWSLRALLVAMDRWVRDGVAPPPSRYPRLGDGTLVAAGDVAFPAIPAVQSPRSLSGGVRASNRFLEGGGGAGAALPLLVPQVDRDGNERAGIRLPELAVPLATYTGWNFRSASIGGTNQLVPLLGSYILFAPTRADRDLRHDPRAAIAERYASRERYLAKVKEAAASLVSGRYLLAADVPAIVGRATEHWELAARARTTTAAASGLSTLKSYRRRALALACAPRHRPGLHGGDSTPALAAPSV